MTHQPIKARIHGRKLATPDPDQAAQPARTVTNWREAVQPSVGFVHWIVDEIKEQGTVAHKQQAADYFLDALDKLLEVRRKFHEENTPPDPPMQDGEPTTGSLHTRRSHMSGLWTPQQATEEDQAFMAMITCQLVTDLEEPPEIREELRQALIRLKKNTKIASATRERKRR